MAGGCVIYCENQSSFQSFPTTLGEDDTITELVVAVTPQELVGKSWSVEYGFKVRVPATSPANDYRNTVLSIYYYDKVDESEELQERSSELR